MERRFKQVDVFTTTPYVGNPVAVVLDGDGLSDEEMQRFSSWTNLSEATFVLPPTASGADYRLRIFTGTKELPFAGHPTLGTCHAWLEAGGEPGSGDEILQECGVGHVRIQRTADGLAFAAPPLLRSGDVEESVVEGIASQLGIAREEILDAQWVDNGPGWVAVLLESADAVLSLRPRALDMDIGVVGPHPQGSDVAFELRAFFPRDGVPTEDPVTGSLNASVGQWLMGTGKATSPYVASQGTALGRAGRIHVSRDDEGVVWVGGGTVTCITGHVEL
jgi:PhzF family phenazine biosynthesis protein